MIVQKTKVIPEGYVDLGLPSGLLWAKCNVGATTETEYGKFFQWSDTVGYEDTSHSTWDTCPWGSSTPPMTMLDTEHDAAYIATNGKAHMPTQDDCRELIANTNVTWTTINGVNGRKFTSKTDVSKYIFIPASGYASYGSVYGRGSDCYVWSSSLNSSNSRNTWFLYFGSSSVGVNYGSRYYGFAVRGVVSAK